VGTSSTKALKRVQQEVVDIKPIERLVRLYGLIGASGAVILAIGFFVSFVARQWPLAIALLALGGVNLVAGGLAYRQGRRRVEWLHSHEDELTQSVGALEFPTVNRLRRMFGWMALTGAVALTAGLGLGILGSSWAIASALIPGGGLALIVGIWARRRAADRIAVFRQKRE
jgi:hypothetical protein